MPTKLFVKGDSRINRKGRVLSKEINALRQLTTTSFIQQFNDLLQKNHIQLYAIAHGVEEPILRAYLAKCLLIGKLRGDYFTMNLMLDRLIGKVKEPVSPDQENVLKELLQAMIGAAKVAADVKEKK